MGWEEMIQSNISFTCEDIWSVERVTDEASNIAQLETIFRDRALTWYMKYKDTKLMGQARSLMEIMRDVLRDI
jgi:hypothetical protein